MVLDPLQNGEEGILSPLEMRKLSFMQLATFQNPPPVNSCLSECPWALTTYMLKSCDSPTLRQSQVTVSGGGMLWKVQFVSQSPHGH